MYVLRRLISRDERILTCLMSFFPWGGRDKALECLLQAKAAWSKRMGLSPH